MANAPISTLSPFELNYLVAAKLSGILNTQYAKHPFSENSNVFLFDDSSSNLGAWIPIYVANTTPTKIPSLSWKLEMTNVTGLGVPSQQNPNILVLPFNEIPNIYPGPAIAMATLALFVVKNGQSPVDIANSLTFTSMSGSSSFVFNAYPPTADGTADSGITNYRENLIDYTTFLLTPGATGSWLQSQLGTSKFKLLQDEYIMVAMKVVVNQSAMSDIVGTKCLLWGSVAYGEFIYGSGSALNNDGTTGDADDLKIKVAPADD